MTVLHLAWDPGSATVPAWGQEGGDTACEAGVSHHRQSACDVLGETACGCL